MPIKQVGVANGAPKETYSQSPKHRPKTQVNRNEGQSPIGNILKHYALIYIVESFRQYIKVYKITRKSSSAWWPSIAIK